MKKQRSELLIWKLSLRAQLTLGTLSVLAIQGPLAGQSTNAGNSVVELEPLTVLGSSITRFDEESGLPVTTFRMETLETDGFNSSGEIFTEMVFTGSPEFEESSDGPNNARGDVTSINLRGAGPGQTLVLMNGRRLAPHPLNQTVNQSPSVLVNANIIPAGLIDRIDVLRDGASAIYGTDASAGVVNTQLETDLQRQELQFRYGSDAGSDFTEQLYAYTGGFDFNRGKTNFSVYLSYFERDPIYGRDRDYAAFGDKRPLVAAKWRDDVSIINVSSGSFYSNLETDLPSSQDALSQNGVRITDSRGRFHLNAPGLSGTTATLVGGQGIDDGTLPRDERYDFAPSRTLTSGVKRSHLFFSLNHEFSEKIKFFGEFGYYHAESYLERAPVVIGTSDAIIIPADNYWNPFGPVTFADGRINPNRLSGITLENGNPLPDAGIDIQLDGWRAEDLGRRLVNVDNDSYLITLGLKGKVLGDWYWESGFRYNFNEATDSSGNRLSKTGFSEILANDTPAALNVFAGPGANNRDDFLDYLLVVKRTAETELFTYDLRVNNPDVATLFGNPVGIAFGAEARKETYLDDRDPRIDGTIRFDQTNQGESDIIGVSPTGDSESDRTVSGVYGEVLIPLVGEANRFPVFHRFEVQLAGRWEDYSDFGDITKPKYGAVWYLTPDLFVRASMAEGFTAPNLSILTQPIQRFNTGIVDDYRIDWDPNNNENDGSTQIADRRGGNLGLGPEQSETQTAGVVVRVPFIEGLTLTVDYYQIEISDRIGTLGTNDILNEDEAILNRLSADPANYTPGQVVIGDPRVERGPIDAELIALATSQGFAPAGPILLIQNPFINEARRKIEGWDFGFEYVIPNKSLGSFQLSGNASYLKTFEDTELVGDPPNNRIQDEINPRLRASLSVSWRKGNWRAGLSTRYISKTFDNDVNSTTGEDWVIDPFWTTNVRGGYRFRKGSLKGLSVTLGIRNLFDVDPPLNPDEVMGYETSLHTNRERFFYTDLKYRF